MPTLTQSQALNYLTIRAREAKLMQLQLTTKIANLENWREQSTHRKWASIELQLSAAPHLNTLRLALLQGELEFVEIELAVCSVHLNIVQNAWDTWLRCHPRMAAKIAGGDDVDG